MASIFAGFDFRRFVKDAVAGFLGGAASEVLVNKLPSGILRTLGEYTTPVLGFALGLLGNYIRRQGYADLGDIVERAGAFMVGNWLWEYAKPKSAALAVAPAPAPKTVTVEVKPAPAPTPTPKPQAVLV